MNHTKNYGLPQWELNDLIRMEDFNSAMSSIETGLDSNAAKAEAAVNTANFAKAAASQKPYVVGSYTGTGKTMSINLGFRPAFLIISGMRDTSAHSSPHIWVDYLGLSGGNAVTNRLQITDTGFTVLEKGISFYPTYVDEGRVYDYIAFK